MAPLFLWTVKTPVTPSLDSNNSPEVRALHGCTSRPRSYLALVRPFFVGSPR